MNKARAAIKSANTGCGVVSAALPGAQKARIKKLTTPATKLANFGPPRNPLPEMTEHWDSQRVLRESPESPEAAARAAKAKAALSAVVAKLRSSREKVAGDKNIPIKADVGGPLANAKEISVKLKRAPKKKEESTDKAAADMGYAAGFCSSVMPADAVFEKVAAKTNLSVQLLKAAYFVKVAAGAAAPVAKPSGGRPPISPLWMLLGGAAIPWLAAPAARELRYPGSGGYGRGRMFEHQFGGLDPRTESELSNIAARRMAVNSQMSSLARRFADAQRMSYAPSMSPYAMGPGGGM
jgi:hypothetical protein